MISISPELALARITATRDFIDAGEADSLLRIYSGTRPPNGDTPGGGNLLLVEIHLAAPAGTIVGTELQIDAVPDNMVLTGGTATWGRLINGWGQTGFDFDVSLPSGAGEIKLSSVNLLPGGLVHLLPSVLR